jgi:hypothetical protein
MGDKDGAESTASGGKQAAMGLLGLLAVLAVAVGLSLAFDHWIMPPSRPVFDHPSAFDALIDSRLVIGLIRLLAIVFAVYIVGSVVAHMRHGRWLVAFGGASADATDRDRENLRRRLKEAEDAHENLLQEYEKVLELLIQTVQTGEDDPETEGDEGGGEAHD